MSALIIREFNGLAIGQRETDAYLNATAMCKAVGKDFFDYERLASTKAFLEALTRSPGIPGDVLTKITTGPNSQRGTWVHPQVAYHLAMWCSPAFAVQVTEWIHDIRTKGYATASAAADAAPFEGFDRNDVRTALLMVSECRTTWGRAQARALWRRLPLPQVADLVPGADVLGEFVATMIVSAPGAKLQSKVLYAGYLSWCRLNSRPPVNTTVFGMELARRGFAKHKSGVLYYDDIALTSGAAHAPR